MTIPTILTLLRILAIPFIVIIYYLPFPWAHPLAAIIFLLAALTDWLDGYLARTLSQTTKLGEFLDPVADKLIVAVALVLVVGDHLAPFLAIPAAIIVGREIAISALREWMAELGKRRSVAVSMVGKIKTTLQLISLIILLWTEVGSAGYVIWVGVALLYVAALLTLWSMFVYLRLAWPIIIGNHK